MITPDKSSTASAETCVPLAAVAIDGVAPTAGDTVEFSAKGSIERIEGDHAYVRLAEVNGQPATQPAGEPDQDDMLRLAEEADQASITA